MTVDVGMRVAETGGLHLAAYPGNNMVLLAMSIPDGQVTRETNNLAGFSIWRKIEGQDEKPLYNRLSFDTEIVSTTTPSERKWTESSLAPFQKFRWVDVPPDGFDRPITYRVQARYFTGQGTAMRDGQGVSVTIDPPQRAHAKFRVAFTRGYASSQAYTDRFHNAPIRPPGPKTPDFDTKPYLDSGQYEWLGADAYKLLSGFIAEIEADDTARVDVFAYDLDEPDIIRAICRLKDRIRVIFDNAALHMPGKQGDPPEVKAAEILTAALGTDRLKRGHFGRYQHNKVFIKRDARGRAQKVFFGSMNFSVRGLFVQANNVMLIDDPATAGYFAKAFDNAWDNATAKNLSRKAFAGSQIAAGYNVISAENNADLPKASIAFSPHSSSAVSLDVVTRRVRGAKSSVLFAVMEPTGQGPVLISLRTIAAQPTVFSYGTVETDSGLAVQNADGAMGALASFAYLKGKVPWPFSEEWSGRGPDEEGGRSIHHKFIVVDFNDEAPVVFAGSSNLAAGGEEQNGDSLIMIEDPVVASFYAIEAVRLFDHYSFRKAMKKATKVRPLSLWYPGKPDSPNPWWSSYYDPRHIHYRDRLLFADLPLPAGLQSTKNVDWASIERLAAKAAEKKKAVAAAKRAASKKAGPAKKTAKKASKNAAKKAVKKVAKKSVKKAAKKSAKKTAKKTARKKR